MFHIYIKHTHTHIYICMYVYMYRYGNSVFHLVSGCLPVEYVYISKQDVSINNTLLSSFAEVSPSKYHACIKTNKCISIGYTNNKPYARSIKF